MVPLCSECVSSNPLSLRDLKGQFCQEVLLRHVLKIHNDQRLSNVHINASVYMADYNHSFYNYFCKCSIYSETDLQFCRHIELGISHQLINELKFVTAVKFVINFVGLLSHSTGKSIFLVNTKTDLTPTFLTFK